MPKVNSVAINIASGDSPNKASRIKDKFMLKGAALAHAPAKVPEKVGKIGVAIREFFTNQLPGTFATIKQEISHRLPGSWERGIRNLSDADLAARHSDLGTASLKAEISRRRDEHLSAFNESAAELFDAIKNNDKKGIAKKGYSAFSNVNQLGSDVKLFDAGKKLDQDGRLDFMSECISSAIDKLSDDEKKALSSNATKSYITKIAYDLWDDGEKMQKSKSKDERIIGMKAINTGNFILTLCQNLVSGAQQAHAYLPDDTMASTQGDATTVKGYEIDQKFIPSYAKIIDVSRDSEVNDALEEALEILDPKGKRGSTDDLRVNFYEMQDLYDRRKSDLSQDDISIIDNAIRLGASYLGIDTSPVEDLSIDERLKAYADLDREIDKRVGKMNSQRHTDDVGVIKGARSTSADEALSRWADDQLAVNLPSTKEWPQRPETPVQKPMTKERVAATEPNTLFTDHVYMHPSGRRVNDLAGIEEKLNPKSKREESVEPSVQERERPQRRDTPVQEQRAAATDRDTLFSGKVNMRPSRRV